MIDPQQPVTTAQQMADFWQWQVETGRGQWAARLCPRGLSERGQQDTVINLAIPPADEIHDTANRVVFVAARY